MVVSIANMSITPNHSLEKLTKTKKVHYNTYLQIGVEGLQALAYYNMEQKAWGEAHKRVSHFNNI